MRRALICLAALALPLAGVAQAAEAPPCLTAPEFTALAGYTMPSIITGLGKSCATALPPGAYLRGNGDALAARYASAKPAAWPGAKAAFLKLSTGAKGGVIDMVRTMPDDQQQVLVDTLVAGAVAQHMAPARCAPVSEMLRLLSPLPPESTAEIVGLTVGLGSKLGEAHFGQISICGQ